MENRGSQDLWKEAHSRSDFCMLYDFEAALEGAAANSKNLGSTFFLFPFAVFIVQAVLEELLMWLALDQKLCRRGIKVTIVCPGPVKTATTSGTSSSQEKGSSEKRVSSERCAELTIIAASHGLKEAWISYQPVLAVMYLVQYAPTVGYWLMDKIGEKRVAAAAEKGNTYSLGLLFGKKKAS